MSRMIQTVSVLAVLTLATVTVLLPRILRGRTNRIADWNWRWILAVMFFLPLALLYIMVWIEMLKRTMPGFEHPVVVALIAPLQFAYAVPCLLFGFLPFAPFLFCVLFTGCLVLGLAKYHTAWGIPLAVSAVLLQWYCVGTMIFVQVALGHAR